METGQQRANPDLRRWHSAPQLITSPRRPVPPQASSAVEARPEAGMPARGRLAGLAARASGPELLDLPAEMLDLIGSRLRALDLLHLSLGNQRTHAILEGHLRSAALCARAGEVRTLEAFGEVLSSIQAVDNLSLCAEPLVTLARRAAVLPKPKRRAAFDAILRATYGLARAVRGPVVTALASVIGALASDERAQVLDALCAAIDELESAARAAPLAMLVRHAPAARCVARAGVVNELFRAIEHLEPQYRSAPLSEMTLHIAALPGRERAAACQRYLLVLDSIDASNRLPPLLALVRQLRIVPQGDRPTLFERFLQYGRQMHAAHRVMVLRELGHALCHLLPGQQPSAFGRIVEDTLQLGPERIGDRISILASSLHLLPSAQQGDTFRYILAAVGEHGLSGREQLLNALLRHMHVLTPEERPAVYDRILEASVALPVFQCAALLATLAWRLPRIEPAEERTRRFEHIVRETRRLPADYRLSSATALAWMIRELPEPEHEGAFATLEAIADALSAAQHSQLAGLLLTLKGRPVLPRP